MNPNPSNSIIQLHRHCGGEEDDSRSIKTILQAKKKSAPWWRNTCQASGKHYDVLWSPSHQQTVITSRNKHVAHLMKVGHKRNKAAKVIRSATGHFYNHSHTSYWITGRNMMNQGSRTCPFTTEHGRFNDLWQIPFIHINSYSSDNLQQVSGPCGNSRT